MKKLKIAFDIDDTLIVPSVATGLAIDTPNYENIALYQFFQRQGHHMILWSGSGIDWAATWGKKLGLKPDEIRVKQKTYFYLGNETEQEKSRADSESDEPYVDLCFDDCDVDLAKVNVKVKRFNNSISREEWNKNKK